MQQPLSPCVYDFSGFADEFLVVWGRFSRRIDFLLVFFALHGRYGTVPVSRRRRQSTGRSRKTKMGAEHSTCLASSFARARQLEKGSLLRFAKDVCVQVEEKNNLI